MTRLRIVRIDNKIYWDDDRLHEFRNVSNPHDVITYEDFSDTDGLLNIKEIAPKEVINEHT